MSTMLGDIKNEQQSAVIGTTREKSEKRGGDSYRFLLIGLFYALG